MTDQPNPEHHESPPEKVRLNDPGELIAAIPHLLGFHPTDSLVLLLSRGDRIELALRVDLPPTEHERLCARQLAHLLLRHDPLDVSAIVVCDNHDTTPPRASLIDHLDEALDGTEVDLYPFWASETTEGATWRSYADPNATGTVPNPTTSQLAAAAVLTGRVTRASRAELAALLAPAADEILTRRAALIEQFDLTEVGRPLPAVADLIDRHVAEAAHRTRPLDDDEIVQLASALAVLMVRDSCLRYAIGEHAADAERLWTELTREVPAPHRAEPAALLAYFAYIRGDGALALLALDRALDASPDHRLSRLLHLAVTQGVPPQALRGLAERGDGWLESLAGDDSDTTWMSSEPPQRE